MTDDPIVRVKHIRAARLCLSGAREWFEAHSLSWQEFVTNGLPASVLEATEDAFALQVTAKARQEQAADGSAGA